MRIIFTSKRFDKFCVKLMEHFFTWLPDRLYLDLYYRFKMGQRLNLKCPSTFSEKLQWLKLYDRRREYSMMVDKLAVKDYVASVIGKQYVIPSLGSWDSPEDIEWELLPKRFVLKTTHGGGSMGVIVCKDKDSFDKQKAVEKLKCSMKQDIYKYFKEWPYKNIKKKVFAEVFIETNPDVSDLPDYKWYCFNGEPKFCQVIQDRTTEETIDFFDTEWKHQEFIGLNPTAGHALSAIPKPTLLNIQLQIASKLSKGIPFSRIDLYEIRGSVYFGEITFVPMGGFGKFRPELYNEILGELINLNTQSIV